MAWPRGVRRSACEPMKWILTRLGALRMGNKSDNAYMYLASSYLGLPDLRPPRGAPIARTHRRPHPIEAGPRSSVSIALPTPDLRLSQLSSRSTPATRPSQCCPPSGPPVSWLVDSSASTSGSLSSSGLIGDCWFIRCSESENSGMASLSLQSTVRLSSGESQLNRSLR